MAAYDSRIDDALARFDQYRVQDSPSESLRLLDDYRVRFPGSSAFADADVLFVQHHLGPFNARIDAMKLDGLDMGRSWFVDIPYSTCGYAREVIQSECPENQRAEPFEDPLEPYADAQLARMLLLMASLADRRGDRLLVVDDGAHFLHALGILRLTRPGLAEKFRGTRIVEQTTRGHRIVERSQRTIAALDLAVVSIALCRTKREFEAKFIGAAVSGAIARAVAGCTDIVDGIRRAAVLGFGHVGAAVTSVLRSRYPDLDIEVVEPDPKKHGAIAAMPATPLSCLPDRRTEEGTYDLVVGCTGRNSFKLHHRHLLSDRAVLASGSSAAVEFNRAGFIELADAFSDDEIEVLDRDATRDAGIHATIRIAHERGRILHFLNAGFPVNFDGRMECLPADMIQPTHCLLYHAGRQALVSPTCGVYEIDPEVDKWLLKESPAYLGDHPR